MGTIYRFSGLDTVIRGLPGVVSRHPGVRLLIVGDGEDAGRLEALAAAEGVSSHVVFAGRQPYGRLPDIIRASDICINPFELNAVTRDILPTKLFQYLACGKPLVATRLPGMLPFLEGEAHGVVYAPLEGFAETLSDLLANPARRLVLGDAARRAMEAGYDWKRIASELASWAEGAIART
jgi:glycosyltransferase involved in cell wall biosynthesis